MVRGIAILCNKNGTISEVWYNSYDDRLSIEAGNSFVDVCNEAERQKALDFIQALNINGGLFNWELNVDFSDKIKPLKFSGSLSEKGLVVIGVESNQDVHFLFEELSRINNEQANQIRQLVKQSTDVSPQILEDEDTYNQLTKLNNELANLQRELARKNSELTRLNEMKNTFLGMAAHDLRNPLGNIIFYADFTLEEANLSDQQKQYLDQIQELSKFMLNMVNDLLNVSTIERGTIDLRLKKHDLVDIYQNLINLNMTLAERKEITLDFTCDLDSAEVLLDKGKIEQVLINLITNAIKFSHKNTRVEVSLIKQNDSYLTRVKDEGQGIPEGEMELLFRPFQKTSVLTTDGEGSTGLGLYIVKNIIKAHKGEIWAESPKGEGASFYFTLPIGEPEG